LAAVLLWVGSTAVDMDLPSEVAGLRVGHTGDASSSARRSSAKPSIPVDFRNGTTRMHPATKAALRACARSWHSYSQTRLVYETAATMMRRRILSAHPAPYTALGTARTPEPTIMLKTTIAAVA
jgi:hypothetical protein